MSHTFGMDKSAAGGAVDTIGVPADQKADRRREASIVGGAKPIKLQNTRNMKNEKNKNNVCITSPGVENQEASVGGDTRQK